MDSKNFTWPKGLKNTQQRREVFDILTRTNKPLSALEIFESWQQEADKNISISTVYRILSAFEEYGMISKTALPDSDTYIYKLIGERHEHYATCLKCHRQVPIETCPFESGSLHSDCADDNFTVTGHKLEIYGYCKECKAASTP